MHDLQMPRDDVTHSNLLLMIKNNPRGHLCDYIFVTRHVQFFFWQSLSRDGIIMCIIINDRFVKGNVFVLGIPLMIWIAITSRISGAELLIRR